MSPNREWKTEGEIRQIVREEEAKTIDLLRDGAQASLNTIILLSGDDRWGIKGFIPETRERLAALEARASTSEVQGTERRKIDDARFETLESGQNKIRKAVIGVCKSVFRSEDGKLDYKKIIAVGTAAGAAANYCLSHMPSWITLKMFAAKLGWMHR